MNSYQHISNGNSKDLLFKKRIANKASY